jgi:hypothetical protein
MGSLWIFSIAPKNGYIEIIWLWFGKIFFKLEGASSYIKVKFCRSKFYFQVGTSERVKFECSSEKSEKSTENAKNLTINCKSWNIT